jgi:hypothetical protein
MKKQHELLIELIQLKEQDYDKFLEKLYEAITTDFEGIFKEELIKEKEHQETLKLMIKHFEKKEEYEKCDVLIYYLNSQEKK